MVSLYELGQSSHHELAFGVELAQVPYLYNFQPESFVFLFSIQLSPVPLFFITIIIVIMDFFVLSFLRVGEGSLTD